MLNERKEWLISCLVDCVNKLVEEEPAIPQQKEESQNDLWEEIETLCRKFDNGDISDQQFKKEKTKYTITRK